MNPRIKLVVGSAVAAGLIVVGSVATAWVGDDSSPISGDALTRATVAALARTGGGRVTGTEVNDEEGKYEVEVTLSSGRQVDVHLDNDFHVINAKPDREGVEGSDGEGDG